jgi:hypothetical protein
MNAPLAFPINGDALPGEIEPHPIEIDPRPCEVCWRTIDQHNMVDNGEGPEFFCYPDDDIVTSWELADPRDAWRRTGEPPPPASVRNSDIDARPAGAQRYRTPQATIDAFWYIAGLDDSNYLTAWLAQHPRDVETLQKLWEAKHARA